MNSAPSARSPMLRLEGSNSAMRARVIALKRIGCTSPNGTSP
jgi:hypothetical protein